MTNFAAQAPALVVDGGAAMARRLPLRPARPRQLSNQRVRRAVVGRGRPIELHRRIGRHTQAVIVLTLQRSAGAVRNRISIGTTWLERGDPDTARRTSNIATTRTAPGPRRGRAHDGAPAGSGRPRLAQPRSRAMRAASPCTCAFGVTVGVAGPSCIGAPNATPSTSAATTLAEWLAASERSAAARAARPSTFAATVSSYDSRAVKWMAWTVRV